jgi:methyl-accepting chemotaxis protein
VKGGRELVDSAGLTMRDVVGSVQRVGQVIDEIAMASSQQSAGAAEVNRAIAQIDQATQHNAALVEEATSAAQSFEAEAARLLDAVRKFKLD